MATATARHILVETEDECLSIKKAIENGADFEEQAKQYSKCPSGYSGGHLGTFRKGQMVESFDKVCFEGEVNQVHGPVPTQFGYHLVEILKRED